MDNMEKSSTKVDDKKDGIFLRLKSGLHKTRNGLAGALNRIVSGSAKIGPEFWQELEDVLLGSDMGTHTVTWLIEELQQAVKSSLVREKEEITKHLKELLVCALEEAHVEEIVPIEGPCVVLIIGINGSGKTTTIGKLAARYKGEGQQVLVAAGDTFRAAATEQLQVWAERVGVPCVSQKSGTDPSAVAYDAIQSAISKKVDRVFVDTAGRLQTNKNLMEELKKIKRVIGKVINGAPHETILVLDASIGQNSLSQARIFNDMLGVDGIVLTKLDGSAKGGVLFNITRELKLPVRYIGVGEKIEDLQLFNSKSFVDALFDK